MVTHYVTDLPLLGLSMGIERDPELSYDGMVVRAGKKIEIEYNDLAGIVPARIHSTSCLYMYSNHPMLSYM